MKKIRFIITALLIVIIFITTYIYFSRQSAENVPKRAILVLNLCDTLGNGENNNI